MKSRHKILFTVVFMLSLQACLNAQSLDSLFQIAVQNNTELKAINLEYEAILAREDQVSQLPNPQLGVGVPILRPETRLGPQMMMVSASQMFPWFGTLDAKKDVVIQMSKVKYEDLTAVRLELFYQIKTAYYELVFLEEKRKLYARSLENYASLESIALSRVEAGQASMADVLRIQARYEEYEILLQQIVNEKDALKAQINQALSRPLMDDVRTVDSIDYQIQNFNLSNYQQSIEEHHPILKKLDHQAAVSKSQVAVAQKQNQPTFGIGVDYSLVNRRTDADPAYNGRDILIPKVMVAIPIYRKAYKGAITEDKLTQDAIAHRKASLTDEMIARIVNYKTDYDNASLRSELSLKQQKKISSAYDILLADYSTDGKRMEEILSTQNELIELNLKFLSSILNMGIAKAKIERLTDF